MIDGKMKRYTTGEIIYKSDTGKIYRAIGSLIAVLDATLFLFEKLTPSSWGIEIAKPEDYIAGATLALTLYFIGDKIDKRELDEAKYSQIERIVNNLDFVKSNLEKIKGQLLVSKPEQ